MQIAEWSHDCCVSFTDAMNIFLSGSQLQGFFGFHHLFRNVRKLNLVKATLVLFNCLHRKYLGSGCWYLIVHF